MSGVRVSHRPPICLAQGPHAGALSLTWHQRSLNSPPMRPYASARGGVAQLVRASACHAEGRGFEPRRSRHFYDLADPRCSNFSGRRVPTFEHHPFPLSLVAPSTASVHDAANCREVHRAIGGEQGVGGAERVAHRVRQRGGVALASDGFMRSAAAEIGEGALFTLAKDGNANVTEVIAQGVA